VNFRKSFFTLSLAVFSLTGCATKEAPSAGFINPNFRSNRPDIPFQKVWIKPGLDFKQYRSIYVVPVSTAYVMKAESWKAVGKHDDVKKDLREAAAYMRSTFISAFKENAANRFSIMSKPTPGGFSLEMALVELVPNSPAMKTASLIPLYGLAATAVDNANPNTVAFEARLIDAKTGEVVMTFGDRRREKGNIVSVKNFTYYSYAYTLMDDWAKEFVSVLNKRSGETVKKSSGFELKPW
jgi:hypothetical protein